MRLSDIDGASPGCLTTTALASGAYCVAFHVIVKNPFALDELPKAVAERAAQLAAVHHFYAAGSIQAELVHEVARAIGVGEHAHAARDEWTRGFDAVVRCEALGCCAPVTCSQRCLAMPVAPLAGAAFPNAAGGCVADPLPTVNAHHVPAFASVTVHFDFDGDDETAAQARPRALQHGRRQVGGEHGDAVGQQRQQLRRMQSRPGLECRIGAGPAGLGAGRSAGELTLQEPLLPGEPGDLPHVLERLPRQADHEVELHPPPARPGPAPARRRGGRWRRRRSC